MWTQDGWDKRYEAEDLMWGLDPNQGLVSEAAELPPGRALDLGCGEGRNSLWLAGRGWQVTGVDFAGVALARAARCQLAEQADVASRLTWVQAESRTPARGERPSTWLWSPTSTRSALSAVAF